MTLKRQLLALLLLVLAAFVLSLQNDTPVDADTVPAGMPGSLSDRGNFRMRCEFSHLASDDPLVAPGQPGASHLHMFFGNTNTSAYSTPNSIRTSGGSTCQGGPSANRSAYWIPSVQDAEGRVRVPDYALVYYKTAGLAPESVQPIPENLQMIAGNSGGGNSDSVAYWSCMDNGAFSKSTTIPNCPSSKTLLLTVQFPTCWDGTNLDSRDHKSHMHYGNWNSSGRTCPSSHPVPLPQITYSFQYTHPEGGTNGWHLSSDRANGANHAGGSTLHGDWMNGWNPSVMQTFIDNCLRGRLDCTGGEMGNGTKLTPTGNGSGSAAILSNPAGTTTPPATTAAPPTTTTTTTSAPPRATAPTPIQIPATAATPATTATTTTTTDVTQRVTRPSAATTTTTTTNAPAKAAGEPTKASSEPARAVASPSTKPTPAVTSPATPFVPTSAPAAVPQPTQRPEVAGEPIPNAPTCNGQPATIVGTNKRDVIRGTAGRDVIWTGGGNDVILSGRGGDIICSGPGHDRIRGGVGSDYIDAGPGRDRVRGGSGADVLNGENGRDSLEGGPGDDVLTGGRGDDTLSGDAGKDILFS